MPNADVFISYRRDQRDQVRLIADKLQELDLSIWFDARLEAGTSFDEEINREIRSAKAVLVCWSPEAIQSRWVRAEASIALERDALVAVQLAPTELMPPFNLIHAPDLSRWNGNSDDAGWRAMLARIGGLVGRPGLAELDRAKALEVAWASRDSAARAEFRSGLKDARLQIEAFEGSITDETQRRLSELERAFENWITHRRLGRALAYPDPFDLVKALLSKRAAPAPRPEIPAASQQETGGQEASETAADIERAQRDAAHGFEVPHVGRSRSELRSVGGGCFAALFLGFVIFALVAQSLHGFSGQITPLTFLISAAAAIGGAAMIFEFARRRSDND
jgi:hypothetical protein